MADGLVIECNVDANMRQTLIQEPTDELLSEGPERDIFEIEPLKDPRWDALVASHPKASVFHSRPWLEALQRTYGYEPIGYTTAAPGQALRDALVFCRVDSWLTGRRLVSLPFSDHCEPLIAGSCDLPAFARKLQQEFRSARWRYIEMRTTESSGLENPCCFSSAEYVLHRLDLRPDLATLFGHFHKDSIQRKIKRSRREGLTCQTGPTDSLLQPFYELLTITRRRHGVPPQPKIWFRHLIDCFGPDLQISVAFAGKRAVAGMLTLRHKDTLVYKYGGSDAQFNRLGSMHCLYWESIKRAKSLGLQVLDLGRSDGDQQGLIVFKNRWGATQSKLNYFRFSDSHRPTHVFEGRGAAWQTKAVKAIFAHAPGWTLPIAGGLMYKHIG